MSKIDTTTTIVTLRTDLGADIPTEQLRSTIDAALTLLQYVAESLSPDRDRDVQFEPGAPPLSRALTRARDRALGSALDPNPNPDADLDLDAALDVASSFALDLASTFAGALARGFNVAREFELARGLKSALAHASDIALGRVSAGLFISNSALDQALVSVAVTLNHLGDALDKSSYADQEVDGLYSQIVDALVRTSLFIEAPRVSIRVLALSYHNPLEIVIDALPLLSGGLTVGGILAALRILFGKGPAERAEAGKKKAETRIKNAEAERLEIENERLRGGMEAAVGRPVAPIDDRVAHAVSTAQGYDWIIASG